eukprot:TRINITY_DN11403_c0_g1_i1.p1 TRINITY_DN11403_c0_g1~~TRINITY_DN11403_c0_g1_i1.p1  ORF type:complete len:230 (+),score=46.29 TRINITY_DN11403_c0_g1_i1:36-692(+)
MELLQQFKPSTHSIPVVLSNLCIIIPIRQLLARQQYSTVLALCVSFVASVLYHLCDENYLCVAPLEILHFVDIAFMFSGITSVALVVSGYSAHTTRLLQVMTFALSLALLAIDRFSVVINMGLWALPLLFVTTAVWRAPPGTWKYEKLLQAVASLVVGLVMFVAGNNALTELLSHQHSSEPESPVYWICHSLWHVIALGVAAPLLLQAKNGNKQVKIW